MKRGSERRKFAREFQVKAVRLLDQPGMSVPKAAADLGVPENTPVPQGCVVVAPPPG